MLKIKSPCSVSIIMCVCLSQAEIMRSGVLVDKGDLAAAEEALAAAASASAEPSVDLLLHRSQVPIFDP